MRRAFATTFFVTSASAASFALIIVSLAFVSLTASAIAAPEAGSPSATTTTSIPATVMEQDDASRDNDCELSDNACIQAWELKESRAYLVETATPGGTMVRQGPEVAIGRLHPEFALRLARAIREAREEGLPEAGVFSAYRPPAYGVGGFKNKYNSLHSFGLAVDMHGIGSPGSSEAKLWIRIAAKHGVVCPYGVNNRAEWNHCQPTRIKAIKSDSPLVKTIAPQGPVDPLHMFEAGKELIESVAKLFAAFEGGVPANMDKEEKAIRHASHRGRRVGTADANGSHHHRHASRQHRQVRHAARKGSKVRSATASLSKRHTVRHKGHRHASRRAQHVSSLY